MTVTHAYNTDIKKLKQREAKRARIRNRLKKKGPTKVFRDITGKPKILLLSDVKGWGAWRRGEYIMKHLSDEFQFTLVDWKTFHDDSFKVNDRWDVFFPLLHILTRYNKVQKQSKIVRTITTVTSRKILKPNYGRTKGARIAKFRHHTRNVDVTIVNNLLVKPQAERWFHGPVKYAPRGVDPDVFKFIDYPMDGRFTVYYVGKPVKEKGLTSIIRPICKRNIGKIRIMINARNWVNALPESKMVQAYNKSNVYIVASTIDGTPNPALEAASCGRPIISNRIGNMPEFIKHGENGFLINKLNTNEYEKRLLWLSENREKAYEMGQRARETVLNGWTWEILLNKNQRKILRDLLKKKEKELKK